MLTAPTKSQLTIGHRPSPVKTGTSSQHLRDSKSKSKFCGQMNFVVNLQSYKLDNSTSVSKNHGTARLTKSTVLTERAKLVGYVFLSKAKSGSFELPAAKDIKKIIALLNIIRAKLLG